GARVFHTLTYDLVHQRFNDLTGSDQALFVQDNWNPTKRLTVTPGVRIDFIRRTDNIFNVTTQRSHELGPRVGVNYTMSEDGRNIARISWSRVHENPVQNWISPGSSAAGFTDRYDLTGNGKFDTSFVTPASTALNPSLFIDVEHFNQPHADELNLGYRRQFDGELMVDIGLVSRTLKGIAYLETNGIYDTGVFRGYRNESLNNIFKITNN